MATVARMPMKWMWIVVGPVQLRRSVPMELCAQSVLTAQVMCVHPGIASVSSYIVRNSLYAYSVSSGGMQERTVGFG